MEMGNSRRVHRAAKVPSAVVLGWLRQLNSLC